MACKQQVRAVDLLPALQSTSALHLNTNYKPLKLQPYQHQHNGLWS